MKKSLELSIESLASSLTDIVGASGVELSDESRKYHSDAMLPTWQECKVIVHPGDAQQVSQIVEYANQNGLKIWPFSTGRNWGYGTTQALHSGGIIVILDRMNRIIEVNEELAYAVLEPGVTQAQLNQHLRDTGSRLWMDCTDSTPNGSVIGNAIERGVGYTPYGDHFGQLCGLEVVLPDGQQIKTGGSQAGCHTRHTHKWGVGPFVDGLFSQSNMGVVTQAGIWLMPEPEEFNFMAVELKQEEDFPQLIDDMRELALSGTIGNVHCFNPFLLLSSRIQYPFDRRGDRTHLPDKEVAALARENKVAPYSMVCGLYGNKLQVKASRKKVRNKLGKYCSILFANEKQIAFIKKLTKRLAAGEKSNSISHRMTKWFTKTFVYSGPVNALELVPKVFGYHKGIPDEFIVKSAYFKRRKGRSEDVNPVRDQCGLVWLAPIVPATSEHVIRLMNAAKPVFDKNGFEFPLSIIMLNPRTLIFLMPLYYDKEDRDECQRVTKLYKEMIDVCSELGYQQYRTGAMCMDNILSNNEVHQKFVRNLKTALDPRNTLAPGKYGTHLKKSKESKKTFPILTTDPAHGQSVRRLST